MELLHIIHAVDGVGLLKKLAFHELVLRNLGSRVQIKVCPIHIIHRRDVELHTFQLLAGNRGDIHDPIDQLRSARHKILAGDEFRM